MNNPQTAFELASTLCRGNVLREPNAVGVGKALKKLRVVADSEWRELETFIAGHGAEIVCRPGCELCCHEPVPVSLLEVIDLAVKVRDHFTDEERAALRDRARAYRESARTGVRFQPCPFLVNGLCSVYEWRPLECRGRHSVDVRACELRLQGQAAERPGVPGFTTACEAMMDALSQTMPGTTAPERYDLGTMAERIAEGGDAEAFLPHALAWPHTPGPVPGEAPGIPDGVPPRERPEVTKFNRLRETGPLDQAFGALSGMAETERLLMSFCVPLAYADQEELIEWRERSEKALSRLEEHETDSAAAFNLLLCHTTYFFAYQGLPVTELNRRFGNWVHDKVIAPLFPDLVAPIESKRKPGKLRVGYASPDLGIRNGTRWSIGWLRAHGAEFETYAINLGAMEDKFTERMIRVSDHYVSLPAQVPQSARAIKELDLDVLIYPEIGQNGRAVQFAAMRLARVQCTGWGFPVTSGLPTVDHYLSGEDMHLPEGDAEFTENLVRMPGTGLILNPPMLPYGSAELPPLPLDYLLMGQNIAKLTPQGDSLFAEICERTGREIVMVEHREPYINAVVKARLARNGVGVHWLPFMGYNQYRALQSGAAATLDTQIWSGGYTTFEAMTLGAPVITLPGESMRSRLSVAFLRRAGVDSLIVNSREEFVRLACHAEEAKSAMRGVDPNGQYGDRGVGEALNDFIRRVSA